MACRLCSTPLGAPVVAGGVQDHRDPLWGHRFRWRFRARRRARGPRRAGSTPSRPGPDPQRWPRNPRRCGLTSAWPSIQVAPAPPVCPASRQAVTAMTVVSVGSALTATTCTPPRGAHVGAECRCDGSRNRLRDRDSPSIVIDRASSSAASLVEQRVQQGAGHENAIPGRISTSVQRYRTHHHHRESPAW